jgi:hypothetical protein
MEPLSFTDLLDSGEPIQVLARVSFLPTEQDGRSAPITGIYRSNHNFGQSESREFYVGQVELPLGTSVNPGESHNLAITFLSGPGLDNLLQVKRTWRIQEGARLVATAEILEVKGARPSA